MPNSAIYAEQLKLFVSQQPIDNATTFEHLWGVFNGAYDDFKAGMFDNLKLEIESSVSCDFLGQADAEMKALLRSSDVGLVPMFPDSCVGVPYKLTDYAAAGLRIVECLGGETRLLVERFHAGAHYEPRNVASLVAALAQPADAAWDAAGFIRQFDAKRIMAEYVAWVESIA